MDLNEILDLTCQMTDILDKLISDYLFETDYCKKFYGDCQNCPYTVICSNFNDVGILLIKNKIYLNRRIEND